MRLRNKVALLASVGTGMGRAAALLFAQEGARVAVAARRREHLAATVSSIQSLGGQATELAGDISVKAEAERIVEGAVSRYGRLDILYCGAGGNFEPTRGLSNVDESYLQQTLTNTITSLYNLAQAVRPVMRSQGGGAIVNIAASFSVRQEGNIAYGAGKGGVIGLSRNLARELYPDNIRVNTIAAGLFRGRLAGGCNLARANLSGAHRLPAGHRLRRPVPGLGRGRMGDGPGTCRRRWRGCGNPPAVAVRGVGAQPSVPLDERPAARRVRLRAPTSANSGDGAPQQLRAHPHTPTIRAQPTPDFGRANVTEA